MLIIYQATKRALRPVAISLCSVRRNYAKDYSSSDDEHDSQKEEKQRLKPKQSDLGPESKKQSAAEKLNTLLASMHTDDNLSMSQQYNFARPGELKKKRKEDIQQTKEATNVFTAARRIASLLGEGNKKQTESELLSKLLGQKFEGSENIATGANTDGQSRGNELNLSEIIVGMKIDRSEQSKESSRSDYVRHTIASKKKRMERSNDLGEGIREKAHQRGTKSYTGGVNLFNGEPLNIFKTFQQLPDSNHMLKVWDYLYQHDLKLQVTHPPANYFEKVARWTEEGKVWRFPIDNEQDLQDEIDVDFSEHIFLEQHLDEWCPRKGPIRHFMELVCVGLSKNPYITAKEKKEHILWFRDYFETKKDILKDFMDKNMASNQLA